MKAIVKLLIFSISLYGVAFADEWTQPHAVGMIQVKSLTSEYYIRTYDGGWGASSCPSSTFIVINSSSALAKEMLAVALAAKVTGNTVLFKGTCTDPVSAYFYPNHIIMQ